GEGEHAAVGVVDEDDLAGAEEALTDDERADLVLGDHPSGVADDVGIALLQSEQAEGVEPRVHARDDGDATRGRHGQVALGAVGGVGLGVGEELVGDAHGGTSRWWPGHIAAGPAAVTIVGPASPARRRPHGHLASWSTSTSRSRGPDVATR